MNNISQIVIIMQEAFERNLRFEMPVNGTSMLPFIHAGDLVTLENIEKCKIKKKDVVFYQRENGQYVLHRIYKIKDHKYIMLGDNQLSFEKGISRNQILAKMVSYKTKTKNINIESFNYRVKISLWNIYFVRFVVLKVKWFILKLKKK